MYGMKKSMISFKKFLITYLTLHQSLFVLAIKKKTLQNEGKKLFSVTLKYFFGGKEWGTPHYHPITFFFYFYKSINQPTHLSFSHFESFSTERMQGFHLWNFDFLCNIFNNLFFHNLLNFLVCLNLCFFFVNLKFCLKNK